VPVGSDPDLEKKDGIATEKERYNKNGEHS
jgi:hypothetical protein